MTMLAVILNFSSTVTVIPPPTVNVSATFILFTPAGMVKVSEAARVSRVRVL